MDAEGAEGNFRSGEVIDSLCALGALCGRARTAQKVTTESTEDTEKGRGLHGSIQKYRGDSPSRWAFFESRRDSRPSARGCAARATPGNAAPPILERHRHSVRPRRNADGVGSFGGRVPGVGRGAAYPGLGTESPLGIPRHAVDAEASEEKSAPAWPSIHSVLSVISVVDRERLQRSPRRAWRWMAEPTKIVRV